MSGGHWDYSGYKIQDMLEAIGEDSEVQARWPTVGNIFATLAPVIHDLEYKMDWDISCDAKIYDDANFDITAASHILDAVLKACPDAWFPRGKWATIQVLQERAEVHSGCTPGETDNG